MSLSLLLSPLTTTYGVLKVWDGSVWKNGGCGTADPPAPESVRDGGVSGVAKSLTFTNVAVGDFLLAFGDTIDDTLINGGTSGWTLHRLDVNASGRFGNSRAYVYYRVAVSAGTLTFGGWTVNKNSTWTLTGMHYRGPTAIVDSAVAVQASTTAWTGPTVTAPSGGGLLVTAYQGDYGNGGGFLYPSTTPAGMTVESALMGSGGFTEQYIFDEVVAAGATGTRSGSTTTAAIGQVQSLLLTPAPSTPGRLKLWDGTQWVREICDDEPVAGTVTVVTPEVRHIISVTYDSGLDQWVLNWTKDSQDFHDTNIDWLVGGTNYGTGVFYLTMGGTYPLLDTNAATPPGYVKIGHPGTLNEQWDRVLPRPLYVWTGTAWDQVACMVPS